MRLPIAKLKAEGAMARTKILLAGDHTLLCNLLRELTIPLEQIRSFMVQTISVHDLKLIRQTFEGGSNAT